MEHPDDLEKATPATAAKTLATRVKNKLAFFIGLVSKEQDGGVNMKHLATLAAKFGYTLPAEAFRIACSAPGLSSTSLESEVPWFE
ncbi:MAG: hypothetical protein IPN53_08850 [Comamonadaceae bacterium]|nr:hypothetical protein [Comamonadaceae bacterium]